MACTPSTPPRDPPAATRSTPGPEPEAKPEAGPEADAPQEPSASQTLRGTLEIDGKPGGKKFQGVWIIADNEVRHVISYRADPWWRPFEGLQVEARGHSFAPRGQAISAAHFRVEQLEVIDPSPDDRLVSIAAERELTGAFTIYTWPEGAKLEGETTTVFRTDDGAQYWLSGVPDPAPALHRPVRITAREVEPSPFMARPGGPYLWVIEARSAP
jgi:hypothetical protein